MILAAPPRPGPQTGLGLEQPVTTRAFSIMQILGISLGMCGHEHTHHIYREITQSYGASLEAQLVKNPPAMQET